MHSLLAMTSVLILPSDNVIAIIGEFLRMKSSVDYQGMNGLNEELESAMRAEMKARNIVSPRLEKTVHLAASLIEVSPLSLYYLNPSDTFKQLAFKDCTFEEKKNIALYNW